MHSRFSRLAALALTLLGHASCAADTNGIGPIVGGSSGYYPGRAAVIAPAETASFQTWLAANQPAFARIAALAAEMKAGTTKEGCIGHTLPACLASLSRHMAVATRFSSGTDSLDPMMLPDQGQPDPPRIWASAPELAGAPVGEMEPSYGIEPGLVVFDLTMQDNLVAGIRARLPKSPTVATDDRSFGWTGLRLALAALGPDCAGMTLAVARSWYDREAKNRWAKTKAANLFMVDRTLCGRPFTLYYSVAGDIQRLEQAEFDIR